MPIINGKNQMGYIVRVSEKALILMILNGIEAYSTVNKNLGTDGRRHGPLETYGNLFGYETTLKNGERLYSIELLSTDTSALQSRHMTDYNEETIKLKADTIRCFWPQFEYLGEFHTHPYLTPEDVKNDNGYYFSDDDRKDLGNPLFEAVGYRVATVLTISTMEKRGRRECQWVDSNHNCVELNLGNLKLWLSAYCTFIDESGKLTCTENNDPSLLLDCPALTGLVWEHLDYGLFKSKGAGKLVYESS